MRRCEDKTFFNSIRSYSVYQGGQLTPSGGTSAASPVTASIIALLNDARLRAGKPALGFLNPLIYFYAYRGFTDITTGQSDGCNGNDTQTGAPTPGVSALIHFAIVANILIGWCYSWGALECYSGMGSNHRFWRTKL
jgi:subtilase family serine protease